MTRSIKLADLGINETSGVDHPAHLHEGWMVMKSVDELIDALQAEETTTTIPGEGGQVDIEIETKTEEAPVEQEDIRKEVTDLRKALDAITKRNAELEATMKAREEEALLSKASERALGWANVPGLDPSTFGETLHNLRKVAPEIAEAVEKVLDATSVAMTEAGILKEVGSANAPEAGDAWSMIQGRANDLVANGTVANFAKAVAAVAEADPDLYTRYLTEKGF